MIKKLVIVLAFFYTIKNEAQALMAVPLTASSSGLQPYSLSEIIIFNYSGLLVSIVSNKNVNIEEYIKGSDNYIVYPNPACNILSIFCKEPKSENKLVLLDSKGTVIRLEVIDKELNVSDLAPGIYFLNINSKAFLKFSKL
ncbi:MAG: T9SS type A sorting domain-containing protein [Saprospiraceae bacterium]